ncbi:MAG: peptide chain release factor N(5)-glutamine methyltransferase [Nitrosomonadales bacterium]|nr:peptide chain release factor N(5)-glutamine methyltransferase [Nitrosomonadales bacterium]
MRNIQNILAQDSAQLSATLALDASTARIEVQCLLQRVLNVGRAWLLAHPEHCMDEATQTRYDELLRRRLLGEPLAYILGEREFFGLIFRVTPATLIPRPETELLVELALQRIPAPLPLAEEGGRKAGRGYEFRVLDLGTGSGAIALAIAHTCPAIQMLACDASADALAVARENAQRLSIGNSAFMQSDWYTALDDAQRFDLIVSNPPYVAVHDPHLQQGDLRFEPESALASGDDGLRDIRHIVAEAPAHLQPGGWLLLEHGYDQAARVRELLHSAGFDAIFSAHDMAGVERVSGGHA